MVSSIAALKSYVYKKSASEIQDTLRSKLLPPMLLIPFMSINPSSKKFGNSEFLRSELA